MSASTQKMCRVQTDRQTHSSNACKVRWLSFCSHVNTLGIVNNCIGKWKEGNFLYKESKTLWFLFLQKYFTYTRNECMPSPESDGGNNSKLHTIIYWPSAKLAIGNRAWKAFFILIYCCFWHAKEQKSQFIATYITTPPCDFFRLRHAIYNTLCFTYFWKTWHDTKQPNLCYCDGESTTWHASRNLDSKPIIMLSCNSFVRHAKIKTIGQFSIVYKNYSKSNYHFVRIIM